MISQKEATLLWQSKKTNNDNTCTKQTSKDSRITAQNKYTCTAPGDQKRVRLSYASLSNSCNHESLMCNK